MQQVTLLDEIKMSWQQDEQTQNWIQLIGAGQESKFTLKHGLLLREGKLVFGKVDSLRQKLLKVFHSSSAAGHSGVLATTK